MKKEKNMKLDMDTIQFESRWEIDDIICALQEWQKSHSTKDEKINTVNELTRKLEVMYMNW